MSFWYFFGSTKMIKNWKSDDGRLINFCKYFFYVIRCGRGTVHDYAKLAKEDDYCNMVKVILSSILSTFPF